MTQSGNPYVGKSHAELCGIRKDYARMKDAAVAARKDAERALTLIGDAMTEAPRQPIEVSDHAVVRYLERARGFDIEAIRAEIIKDVRNGIQVASERIRGVGKLVYVISGDGHVVTVMPPDTMHKQIMGARHAEEQKRFAGRRK